MAKGSCREPRVKFQRDFLYVEILSDWPLYMWVICHAKRQVARIYASVHRVVLEIAMATVGETGSTTAIIMHRLLTGKYSQRDLISGL